jgi:Ca-activated chloride channel family protein
LIHAVYDSADLRGQLARLGYDADRLLAPRPGERRKLYAENVRADADKVLRDLLVAEALDFGLASSETAFVATRTEAGKPVEGTVLVANALPSGWSEEFLTRGLGAPAMLMAAAPVRTMRPAVAGVQAKRVGQVMALEELDLPAFLRRSSSSAVREAEAAASPLFSGVPRFSNNVAVLFDSTRPADATQIPAAGVAQQIEVRFPAGAPRAEELDAGLALLIFVDDLSAPRAKVRLADIVRQGGRRPLNLRRLAGQVVRIVLADPAGAWAQAAPALAVTLVWL